MSTATRIWDLPLRLFHWALVVLVSISIYTGLSGGFYEMDYHMMSGYGILALVLFRIIWGFIGSTHSRFVSFVSLRSLLPYSRRLFRREPSSMPGHNPLGALSVLAFIAVLIIQASTGLFANDDIFLEGPLTHLVSDETSDLLTTVHHINVKVLFGLLGLHLLAIAFHELYKNERLVSPMFTGKKKGFDTNATKPVPVIELGTAMAILAMTAGFVYGLITYV
jgi:cytochrome b